MTRLHGFTKTFRYNLLMSADAHKQACCTTRLYRQVVSYYLQVFQEHQEIIGHSRWLAMAERFTHRTRDNPNPEYPFDREFPNLPAGFRRSAIAEAHGKALAWKTSYERWNRRKHKHEEKNRERIAVGKKPIQFKEHPPRYPGNVDSWLSYYGTEYKWLDSHHILLKMFNGKSYVYRKAALLQPFVLPEGYAAGSPVLIRKRTGWKLHVPVVQVAKPNLKSVKELAKDPFLRICAVDLGINRHAVMSIQDTKGRILAVKFIHGAQENHLRKRCLEKIVRLQAKTGIIPERERFARDLWDKIARLNNETAHRVSRRIVDFAQSHGAKIIVFEHLGSLKPAKGTKSHRLNQKFIFWVKGRTFQYTRYKALHQGIITCRVSPKETSRQCPYCGSPGLVRYNNGKKGVDLAGCPHCGMSGVNADYIGSVGIGGKFRLKYITLPSGLQTHPEAFSGDRGASALPTWRRGSGTNPLAACTRPHTASTGADSRPVAGMESGLRPRDSYDRVPEAGTKSREYKPGILRL